GKNNVDIIDQRVFLVLSATYPLAIIYSLVPLRESYFLFGIGLLLIGVMKNKPFNIYLIFGLVITILMRIPYIMYILFILFFKYTYNFKYRFFLYLILLPIFFILAELLSQNIINNSLTPEGLASFRNYQGTLREGPGGYPPVNWTNWLDVIFYFPKLFLQFLVAPLPVIVKIDFWTKYAYFADGLFVVFIVVMLLFNNKKIRKYKFWIFNIFIFISLTCMFEYFLTGAVRHRYPAILMMLPMLSSLYKFK
ncbi:MAG: hypothetical protein ACOCRK_10275, partial [bacterium]